MDNTQYLPEEENNKYKILKKRILTIFKSCKYYNETNININNLKKYLPKEREFALFLFDFLETKSKYYLYLLNIIRTRKMKSKNFCLIMKIIKHYTNMKKKK